MHRAKGTAVRPCRAISASVGHPDEAIAGSCPGMTSRQMSGKERRIVSPIGPRADVEHDPIHRFIELSDEEKSVYEQARLLYVACTRAKASLHLIGPYLAEAGWERLWLARRGSLLHILWPSLEPEFARQFESTDPPEELRRGRTLGDTEAAAVLSSRGYRRKARTLTDHGARQGQRPAKIGSVEFYWVGSEARLAGTLVHRYLQRLAEAPAEHRGMPGHGLDYRPLDRGIRAGRRCRKPSSCAGVKKPLPPCWTTRKVVGS